MFKRAKGLCGAPGIAKAEPSAREVSHLDALLRGAYARRDFPEGHALQDGEELMKECKADQAMSINHFDTPYARDEALRAKIEGRGL